MKPTEQEIFEAGQDKNTYPTLRFRGAYLNGFTEGANWAISQMQPDLTILKRHDKQLRGWINSMTYEIKLLKTALKDTQEFSSDEQLSEWLFDQDYHTQVILEDKTESSNLPQPPTK